MVQGTLEQPDRCVKGFSRRNFKISEDFSALV
jgi:hypothetical protein